MDWSNERYVRVYTRDTTTWKMLDWRARTLLLHLIRKVDRAGVLEVGEDGLEGVAAMVELPLEIVEEGLAQLVARKTIVSANGAVVLPNFMPAQEATSSDAQRKRDQRERHRATAMGAHLVDYVTHRDGRSRTVTDGHETGQKVTRSHAQSRAVTPSLAEPEEEERRCAASAAPCLPGLEGAVGVHPTASANATEEPPDHGGGGNGAAPLGGVATGSASGGATARGKAGAAARQRIAEAAIAYLNAMAGRRFSVGPYRERLGKLVEAGRTLEDFKAVIDDRVKRWKGDAKMDEYLRPKTLFALENFENYLGGTKGSTADALDEYHRRQAEAAAREGEA